MSNFPREWWAVAVMDGSRWTSAKYPYFAAQLFEPVPRKRDGVLTYRSTGRHVGPFRSRRKAEAAGRRFAANFGAQFVEGYGSLHNQECPIQPVKIQLKRAK